MAPVLVLASSSPRRRRALAAAGFEFVAASTGVDERPLPGEPPEAMVRRLALRKVDAVVARSPSTSVIVGFDTTVVLDRECLGKPLSVEDAVAMLETMSGRTHVVLTGWSVHTADRRVDGVEESTVTMRAFGRAEAIGYVATGEPLDKAGSYAIQGFGEMLVAGWTGSFQNVLGLPIEALTPVLERFGVRPASGP